MTKRRLNLRNIVKIGVAFLAVAMMFSGCKKDNPIIGFAYHDNGVEFVIITGDSDGNLTDDNYQQWRIMAGKFTLTAFDVTSGQDPDNFLKIGNTHTMEDHQFTFRVGRKASKDVANSFNAACPPERNTFNHTAGELNFWVKGDMELKLENGNTYTFQNTYFAQGHSGASNNWWFGNDAMTNSTQSILIYDPYSTMSYYIPIPIYFGDKCFGYISPVEDPNLVFKYVRGEGALWNPKNWIELIGVYRREQPAEPW